MENKQVGWLIIGIALVIVGIIFLFNSALKDVVKSSCSMEESVCPMYKTISQQTYLSLAIVGVLVMMGIIFLFMKPKEKIIVKKIKDKQKEIDISNLEKDEKEVVKILKNEGGAIFQSTLMEKLESGKVKITRLLDKLEAKQIIERKRRGMNNIVVLKR
jgi:uncharacterized protein with ATP-grasp and redox domains